MRKPPKRRPNYKFEYYWTDHPHFKDNIQSKWETTSGDTMERLNSLGEGLTKWSMQTFGDTKREIESEKQKLVDLQATTHSVDIREEEKEIFQKIITLEKRDKMFWQQRNKSKWIPSTDKNTQVFHVSVIHRRSKNKIIALKQDDGEWISDNEQIKNHLLTHFQNVFTKDSNVSPNLFSFENSNMLSEEDCRSLSTIPNAEEIFNVVKNMGSLKFPGPDGYPAVFYKKC
ncbi:uncharacterized protein LOC113272303 [Papaver somniferum]|uniref:uncharacterized protein LOC113272303 n=1 Tax=Papaver somniferum TaxID=3469 RepID=UPI000E704506|nr:uncharacterized protein LOC113272303 [Papaver somniferum]